MGFVILFLSVLAVILIGLLIVKQLTISRLDEEKLEILMALFYTVEYVGNDTLPKLRGWEWYEAFSKYAPHLLSSFPDPQLKEPKRESNYVKHARRELELLGEEYDTIVGYLKIIQAFSDMGHSGGSASVAIPTINALLQFQNLKPLTNNPAEWTDVGEQHGFPLSQSKRCSEAFSEDGGKTYYLLSERTRDEDDMVVDIKHVAVSA